MVRKWLAAMAVVGLAVSTASAQDAKTVLANASKAMGVENLNSIYFYGTAQNGNLGQNNNANQPWPMAAQNDYVRAIDFGKPASRATWATYAVPVTGGRAALAQGTPQTQQLITPETQGWAQQLEIWITPWGFLKGAAANNATVGRRPSVDGGIRRSRGIRRSSRPAARPIEWSDTSTTRTWSNGSRPGSRIRSSATCSSKRSTPTIATTTA